MLLHAVMGSVVRSVPPVALRRVDMTLNLKLPPKRMAPRGMRVAPKTGFRVYQVVAGMPTPTFLIFSSIEDYAEFDAMTAAHQDALKAQTSEEQAARQKFQTEGVISSEMNRFKLDPVQSYVSKETRAKDPAFWSAK